MSRKLNATAQQELDSECARADFESVLQVMVEKANAPESLPSTQSDHSDEKEILPPEAIKQCVSPVKTRKRRRKDNTKEDRHKNTYIIKLFDRSVDLARFSEDSPLYPVCRAWMRNDPCRRNALKRGSSLLPSDRYDSSSAHTKQLHCDPNGDEGGDGSKMIKVPSPDQPWENIGADGTYRSPRIPSPVPRHNQSSIDNYLLLRQPAPAPENLLLDHLGHWRKVREKWRVKSFENEARYKTGMNKLQQIFQRNALCMSQSSQQH